jgi:predicted dehydrogenase
MTPIRLNRRRFLGASAAAGLALSQGVAAGEGRPVRVGLVGLGSRGTTLLRTLLELPAIEVAAVADAEPKAARRASGICQRAGRDQPALLEDSRELLAREDLEAVLIALPCDLHTAAYLDAIRAGKHLYAEKPLASTLAECDAVISEAARYPDRVVHVGFQRRSNPRFREAIELIRRGELGRLVGMRGRWISSNGPVDGHDGWLGRRERSGDWMVEQGVHVWDVLSWMLGGPPQRAVGHGRRDLFADLRPGRDVTDWYEVMLDWPEAEFRATFSQSWVDPADQAATGVALRVVGTEGAVELNHGVVTYRDHRPRRLLHPAPSVPDTRLALAAFVSAVRAPEPPEPPVSLGEAREATRVGLLVRQAVDAGLGLGASLAEVAG